MQVHDVFRNYLARMLAFDGSRSLLTVENRSQLTVILFDWSDKNSCSISYEKWGKTDNLLVTQNLAHNYFIPCFSSYLLVTSSDTSAVTGTPSSRVRIVVSYKKSYKLSTAELKLAGITLKLPKMLRKHHIFRQGDKVRNSDVFLLLFLTLK